MNPYIAVPAVFAAAAALAAPFAAADTTTNPPRPAAVEQTVDPGTPQPDCHKRRSRDHTDWAGLVKVQAYGIKGVKCTTGRNKGYVRGDRTRISIGSWPPRVCTGNSHPHPSEGFVKEFEIMNMFVEGHRRGHDNDVELLATGMSPLCRKTWEGHVHGPEGDEWWLWGRSYSWGGDLGMNRRERRLYYSHGAGSDAPDVTWFFWVRPICAHTPSGRSHCGPDYQLRARRLGGRL